MWRNKNGGNAMWVIKHNDRLECVNDDSTKWSRWPSQWHLYPTKTLAEEELFDAPASVMVFRDVLREFELAARFGYYTNPPAGNIE